ncbi:MAG: outer membrane lipid asymmetry maintenance protein MlaD [Pseudomonadota bacterium]
MANSTTETLIGGLVLATAAGFLIYSGQTIGLSAGGDARYEIKAAFTSAQGVNVGSVVRMAGVEIGVVSDMALDLSTYQAVTTLAIDESVAIPDDSDVKIASEGLLGGTFIEITPGASPDAFAAGDEFMFTQGAIDLLTLMMRFASGGDEG